MKHFINILASVAIFTTFMFVSCEYRNDQVKSLEGRWKFSIGDNMLWAKTDFDDTKWDNIRVPDTWENQGYRGYNGFAWYRKRIRIENKLKDKPLYLHLGRIDDTDEVYFNGVLIGKTGSFPPTYVSKHTETRRYLIPKYLINFGKDNTIAVRVYDNREVGGIRNGDIGLFTKDELTIDVDLAGKWKFSTNDSLLWKEPDYNDSRWNEINVPDYYENQGYENYDGFSWYRKKFAVPTAIINQKLVLIMGRIDDIDQVYINGTFIGGIGTFRNSADSIETENSYNEFRGYYLPDNLALNDTGNIIAVRIFDKHGNGGIYDGPIGLITQENYSTFWTKTRKEQW